MITNIKEQIRSALLGNTNLVNLLGQDRFGNIPIYQLAAVDDSKFPRITFFEVDNSDTEFADDKPYGSQVIPQIDIWSKGSTSAIAGEVDKTMKELGYTRSSAPDFYEADTKIYHKSIRYRNKFQEE